DALPIWGNRADAADLEFHIQQLGHLLAGGKLVGDGPARLTGAEAELALPAQIIDLEHHTIYLVGQTAASLADVPVVVQAAVDTLDQLQLPADRQSPVPQPMQYADLGIRQLPLETAKAVTAEFKVATGSDARVQLT